MIIHWVLCFFPLNHQTNPVVKPGPKEVIDLSVYRMSIEHTYGS